MSSSQTAFTPLDADVDKSSRDSDFDKQLDDELGKNVDAITKFCRRGWIFPILLTACVILSLLAMWISW